MNKKALAAHAAAGAGALLLLLLVAVQMALLGKLQQSVDSLADRLAEHDSRISSELSDAQALIDQSLAAGAGLFDSVETVLRSENNGLFFNVSVIPKTTHPGDEVFLGIGVGSPVALTFSPDSGTYSGKIDAFAEELTPYLKIVSADGTTQQETLDKIYPLEALSLNFGGGWRSILEPETEKDVLLIELFFTETLPPAQLTGIPVTVSVRDESGDTVGIVTGPPFQRN